MSWEVEKIKKVNSDQRHALGETRANPKGLEHFLKIAIFLEINLNKYSVSTARISAFVNPIIDHLLDSAKALHDHS